MSLSGLWQPRITLKNLYYGSGCVEQYLLGNLPGPSSKVFIITGTSLATKTPLVRQLEEKLGKYHAGTISGIGQHGPIADVERAIQVVLSRPDVDTILSLGGGSPIDTAKVISLRVKENRGTFLTHLTIPTTLSAAECTAGGGYTKVDGVKVGFRAPEMGVSAIFYDPEFARYTPKDLWLSTGMRAMDHAVECMYHPSSTEVPWKVLSIWAVGELFECLPKARESHPCDNIVTTRLMLAAYVSSGLKGENLKGGMGLSHSLGHALGSPYGIPHGITSCMTLGKVVKLKAHESAWSAKQISRLLPGAGGCLTGDDLRDALEVGDRIIALVRSLGLDIPTLSDRGVSKDQTFTIAQRALGGAREGPAFDRVLELLQTLF
ncbi:putative Maleylacetate reductase [Periconia macrospinosa]|uniref:Putative Maleylacetate reductase n=1 Tax=Periconia macrospinosa TaxID=97972 RepID=A0A2V1D5Y4_9PLEO|nr:putative Maleylacetate reductase [Periconia macrospinosa]